MTFSTPSASCCQFQTRSYACLVHFKCSDHCLDCHGPAEKFLHALTQGRSKAAFSPSTTGRPQGHCTAPRQLRQPCRGRPQYSKCSSASSSGQAGKSCDWKLSASAASEAPWPTTCIPSCKSSCKLENQYQHQLFDLPSERLVVQACAKALQQPGALLLQRLCTGCKASGHCKASGSSCHSPSQSTSSPVPCLARPLRMPCLPPSTDIELTPCTGGIIPGSCCVTMRHADYMACSCLCRAPSQQSQAEMPLHTCRRT